MEEFTQAEELTAEDIGGELSQEVPQEEAAQEDELHGEQDERRDGIRRGVAELYEDGWTPEELENFSQDEQARRDVAHGISVSRAACLWLRRGAGVRRGVPVMRGASSQEAGGPRRIEDMTDRQFDEFSRRAEQEAMAGRKIRM